MDASSEAALRILDELKREGIPTGPVALSEAYLRAVARLEAQPEYGPGADKTWVLATARSHREMRARAVRVR